MADWRELRKQLMARQQGIPEDTDNTLPEGFAKFDDESNEEYQRRWHSQFNSVPSPFRKAAREVAYRGYLEDELSDENRPAPEDIVQSGYGSDRRDLNAPFETWAENPSEYRAQAQSSWSKFGNGLFKMFPTAASTFLDNTIGLVFGLGNVAVDAVDGEGFHPTTSFINNPFSETMEQFREWSERVAPNYRTEEEIEDADEWWKHLNANFWGDTFVKNLGFTIGAGAAGGLYARGFQKAQGRLVNEAYKAAVAASAKGDVAAEQAFREVLQGARMQDPKRMTDVFRKVRKSYGRLSAESNLIGGIGGAMGESRTEALMAAKEFRDEYLDEAINRYRSGRMSAYREVLSNPNNVRLVPDYDGYGNIIGQHPELNERGQMELEQRQQELLDAYNSEVGTIENEATKLANTTYWLNMPLLSAENMVMFGRMFSGGFNTQAKSKVRGGFGNYSGTGSAVSPAANGLWKATAEGIEEISQKAFSEGSKNVAAHNMAAFYNGAYDEDSIKDVSDWMLSMLQSTGNVLADPTSWEEFAVGALTGALFSVPTSNGWSGGLIGGVQEERERRDASRDSAKKLNETIADPEFRKRWEDLVRHNYYEKRKDEALKKNDSYTWHGENDAQLINDVMMFANAGKLNDLEDYIDSFADISLEEVQKLRSSLVDEMDPDFQNKPDEYIQEWLKKRAFDVKRTIEQYRDFHDSIDFLSFGTSDEKAINELIFTKSQLRNFEDRYQRLASEVVGKITPTLQTIADEVDAKGNPTQRAQTARQVMSSFDDALRLFGGFALDIQGRSQDEDKKNSEPVMLDNARQAQVLKQLEQWGAFTGDPKVKQEVQDLQKLIRSRQDFYARLFNPTFRKSFEEEAKKPEQVAKKLEKKVAEKKAATYDSVDSVRTAFRATENDEAGRTKLMNELRTAKDSNPYVARFLELNKLSEDYQSVYNKSKNRPESDSPIGVASQFIAARIFENATSVDDVYKDSDNLIPSRATIRQYLRGYVGNTLDDTRIEDAVNGAIDTVRGTIRQLVNLNNYHSAPTDANGDPFSSGSLRQSDSQAASNDDGGAFPSLRRGQQGQQRSVPKAKKNKDGSYQDKLGRKWSRSQTVYLYKLDDEDAIIPTSGVECVIDSISDSPKGPLARLVETEKSSGNSKVLIYLNDDSIVRMQATRIAVSAPKITVEQPAIAVTGSKRAISNEQILSIDDAGIPEVAEEIVDETKEQTGVGELDYYHQSIPEIDSWEAKAAREIANDPALSDAEKAKRIAALDLRNFYERKPEFADTWQALASWRGQNAFDNIIDVRVNDRVKFVIDPKFPKAPNGDNQVLVMLDRGGEEKDLLLTVLHAPSKRNTGQYLGISDLHQKIADQYSNWEAKDDNDLFVFNNPDGKPFTSRVFLKRNGFIVYGKEEKPIGKIASFDSNAPIMFIGRNGAMTQLAGSKSIDRTQLSKLVQKLYDKGGEYNPTGNLYYLAKDSLGRYSIPVRLGVEHYNHNTRTYSNDTFNDINESIENIANLVSTTEVTDAASLDKLKSDLADAAKDLSKLLDIHNLVFTANRDDASGRTRLLIFRNDIKREGRSLSAGKNISDVTADWISKILAGVNPSVNVSNTSNVRKMIEDDILTSNAEAMRPKGTDFCFEHWDDKTGKFVETSEQRKVKDQVTGAATESAPEQETPVKTEDVKPKVDIPEGKIEKPTKTDRNVFTYARQSGNSYEVSSAGDSRFSAFNAKFADGTIIDGEDVSGRSIEYVYQNIIKKSGKGKAPSVDSRLYNPKLKTKDQREEFSYREGYLPLWQEWARQNLDLIEELRQNAKGKVLTDKFANTLVSQARALADILNDSAYAPVSNTQQGLTNSAITWNESYRIFDNLPKQKKKNLLDAGCDPMDWNDNFSDADRKKALGCS